MADRRAEAEATLVRLGLDPAAVIAGRTGTDALAAIMAGPAGVMLADALGELACEAVARVLVAVEPQARDREARRAIRRALYRLRQRGIPTPEPAAPPAEPRRQGRPSDDLLAEGLLSHVDGRGDRLIWLVRSLPAGGLLRVAAQVNEPAGLLDVQALEPGRKALRAARQRLEREAQLRLVPAPWRTLDALLVEAHARAGSVEPSRDYTSVRRRFTVDPPEPPVEPLSPHVSAPTGEDAWGLAAGAAALLEEPELRTWGGPSEAAAPFAEEIAHVRESPLVLSDVQQQERVREILRRAARALHPPDVLARRLEGTAYVLGETGRVPAARRALALAVLLRERPEQALGGPFFTALTERAVGALLANEAARQEDARRGSLVMTPGQFLQARASSRRERTRG